MLKTCVNCSLNFEITDDDLKFYDKISPVFNGKKYPIPAPTHCPDCRQQRRLAACNEMNLYRGECDLCHRFTLTQFPPTQPRQLNYCRECWHSDKWDPCDYGRNFNFNRPFFEQICDLQRATPAQALHIDGTVQNSDYMHYAGSSKNSYLICHADFCDECYYGYGFKKNVSCVDGFYNLHCELCYDCVDVHKCYDLKACQDCSRCFSGAFLHDCIGCKNCFLSVGLRNKEYYFENKQLTKEEYLKRVSQIDTGSHAEYKNLKFRLREMELKHTFKCFHGHNTENSLGDYLNNCKNAKYCFDCEDVEDAKFCYQMVLGSKDIYDICQYGTNLQQSYESAICGQDGYHIYFTQNGAMNSRELFYCWYTEHAKNCFGCCSVHHKQFCILNKQYSEKEYSELVPRIIEHMIKTGEWGEFLPVEISSFGYNKTLAQMYYPLTREKVLEKGWQWDDYEPPQPEVSKKIKAEDLPDNIKDVTDEILNSVIECETSKKLFKITAQELKFYRNQHVPLPRKCFAQRHFERFLKRNPRKFWKRNCAKCGEEIQTTYPPNRPEIVYCETCYLQTVY